MAELLTFRHATPAFRTFCGADALLVLATEQQRVGCQRAVILCGRSMLKHPQVLDRVAAALGDRLVGRFSGVQEHSPIPVVQDAARELERLEADSVIAVGGGSAIVTARAAGLRQSRAVAR
jgi:alcohol dehydrogenase class IV